MTPVRVDVYFSGLLIEAALLQQRTVVVVDVLRATSSIVEALANGARAIYPTASSEDAIKLANSLGREDTLLCGERKGVKIEGYDLGNSPSEFTRETIGDKRCVMNTTNGTRTLAAAAGADRVIVASFLNVSAVAGAVADADDLAIVCAGREGRFSLDDAVCAGMILHRLDDVDGLNDGARAAATLADSVSVDASFLRGTEAGQALVALGLDADLELCARVDRYDLVPEMHDRMIRL